MTGEGKQAQLEVPMARGVAGFSPAALQRARAQDQLSRSDLAVELGVSAVTIGRWENGSSRPTASHLQRIAEIFQAVPEDFVRLTGTVRQMRHLAGFSLHAAAQAAGIAPATLQLIEQGTQKPVATTVSRLALAYQQSEGEVRAAVEVTREGASAAGLARQASRRARR